MDTLGNKLRMVPWDTASLAIEDGWLLQYRGTGWISSLIQRGTGSVHSHSAMTVRNGADRVDVMEIRELVGGRRQPLFGQVTKYPGQIDVFKPSERFPEYNPTAAVGAMRQMTSCGYGYRSLIRVALRKIPLVWRFYKLDARDMQLDYINRGTMPFCSMAVSLAVRSGGVDMVPWLPDYLVTPGNITNSLFSEYWGTLTL